MEFLFRKITAFRASSWLATKWPILIAFEWRRNWIKEKNIRHRQQQQQKEAKQ